MIERTQKEVTLPTLKGDVRIRSFCTPKDVQHYTFDPQFTNHGSFSSIYTRRETLEKIAEEPDANLVVALVRERHIIGHAVLSYPEPGERWADLGPGLMMEVKAIEVVREWRKAGVAAGIVQLLLDHPFKEDKIIYLVGYSWTWDLEETRLDASEYRRILIKLFEPFGFREYSSNEPNICLKRENIFLARVGKNLSETIINRFKWLRFGLRPWKWTKQI